MSTQDFYSPQTAVTNWRYHVVPLKIDIRPWAVDGAPFPPASTAPSPIVADISALRPIVCSYFVPNVKIATKDYELPHHSSLFVQIVFINLPHHWVAGSMFETQDPAGHLQCPIQTFVSMGGSFLPEFMMDVTDLLKML